MAKIVYKQESATFSVAGNFDDATSTEALLKFEGPVLALNFQGMSGLTSLGTRKLREVIASRGDAAIEFHECPSFLVNMMNIVPNLIDQPGHRVVVTSFYVPYRCDRCNVEADVLVKYGEVKVEGNEAAPPVKRCHQCRAAMRLQVSPYDYFVFITGLI